MTDPQPIELAPVSETAFLPLYALALESRAERPIVSDPEAVRLTERLDQLFATSPVRIHRVLARGDLPQTMVTTVSLRIRHFDELARDFLRRQPGGVVVELGAGLSARGRRADDGAVRWFALDLPPIIELRSRYLPDTERLRSIAADVLEPGWLEQLPHEPGERFLFLAEGLFMYLEPADVRALVARLRERFPGAELAAEFANARVARLAASRLGRGKMRRQFGLSQDVWFRSGLTEAREVQRWAPGVALLGEWTHFDEDEPRLGWMRWLARWELFGRSMFVARYRLGPG
jgi:methyltransferase (TIGR00027 family)